MLTFGASELNSKSSLRREVHIDGRAQNITLKLPAGSHAGSVVPGATLPGTILTARVVHVKVEPIDAFRCLLSFHESHASRQSALLSSIASGLVTGGYSSRSGRDSPKLNPVGLEMTASEAASPDRRSRSPNAPADVGSPMGSQVRSPVLPSGSPDLGTRRSSIGSGGGLLRRTSLRRATPIVAVHGVDSPRGPGDADGAKEARRRSRQSHQVFAATEAGQSRELELMRSVLIESRRASTQPEQGQTRREQIWHGDDAITRRQISVTVDCEAVQISVVDSSPMELLYVTLGGFSASFTEGLNEEDSRRIEQRFQLDLKSIQVDNQRYRSSLPVTLASAAAEGIGVAEGSTSALRVSITRDLTFARRRFAYVRHAQIHVSPLVLMIDEESARAFASFFDIFERFESAREKTRTQKEDAQHLSTLFEYSMLIPVHNSADSAHASVWSKIFIEALEVSALSVRATVKRAPSGSQGLSLNPLLAIVDTISTALISIDDAPVNLKAFKNYHVFSGPSDVAGRISRHYQIELWWSILSVMLSLDCFGKPYETFTDLAYALQRLLIVPVGTLFSSRPWRFPTAFLFGFLDAVKILVHVVFNSISKILQAWAKGLTVLTLDATFAQQRLQRTEFRSADNILQGVLQGLRCLVGSAWAALYGMISLTAIGFSRTECAVRSPVSCAALLAVGSSLPLGFWTLSPNSLRASRIRPRC